MTQYGDHDRNVDTEKILPTLANQEAEYYVDIPSPLHMK